MYVSHFEDPWPRRMHVPKETVARFGMGRGSTLRFNFCAGLRVLGETSSADLIALLS